MIKKLYYRFFVVLYRFYYRFGEKDLPHVFSAFLISLLLSFNLASIFSYLEFKKIAVFDFNIDTPIFIAVFALNYFILLHKKKYKTILENYDHLDLSTYGWFIFLLILFYIGISIIFFVNTGLSLNAINSK